MSLSGIQNMLGLGHIANAKQRLESLSYAELCQAENQSIWGGTRTPNQLDSKLLTTKDNFFSQKFREAGVFSKGQRSFYMFCFLGYLVALVALGLYVTKNLAQSFAAQFVISLVICSYLGLIGILFFLRSRARAHEQEVLLKLPLALEGLILLVQSGLGVLPAIDALVKSSDERNPVMVYLKQAYDLSSNGLAFRDASRVVSTSIPNLPVLRHVLLHLDISQVDGGEILPSLRSLSDYCQAEWKLSVQSRVRRLENLVVFPVFLSVIGLLFLTAAVPIVPILELQAKLDSPAQSIKAAGSPGGTNTSSSFLKGRASSQKLKQGERK